jgi:antitoxin component of MazEF toxin-antitoxin module
MGFPTKIQLIKRAASEQWYVNFPSAVAQAMELQKGEVVEWVIEDKQRLTLKRTNQPVELEKKKLRPVADR